MTSTAAIITPVMAAAVARVARGLLTACWRTACMVRAGRTVDSRTFSAVAVTRGLWLTFAAVWLAASRTCCAFPAKCGFCPTRCTARPALSFAFWAVAEALGARSSVAPASRTRASAAPVAIRSQVWAMAILASSTVRPAAFVGLIFSDSAVSSSASRVLVASMSVLIEFGFSSTSVLPASLGTGRCGTVRQIFDRINIHRSGPWL